MRLEGFELLCQKHTVVVVGVREWGWGGTEKQTRCESDPQQKPTSLIWFNQDRQIHEPEPTLRVCFSKLHFRSKEMFLSDKNINNLFFAYLCNKSESGTVWMILTFAADLWGCRAADVLILKRRKSAITTITRITMIRADGEEQPEAQS